MWFRRLFQKDDMPPVGEIVSDELLTEGIVVGAINPSKSYAVFSTAVDSSAESLNFLFLIPLTVLAWERIGFGSVVIFVGPANLWYENEIVRLVVSHIRQLDAVAVFLEPRAENVMVISRVCDNLKTSAGFRLVEARDRCHRVEAPELSKPPYDVQG
jgi:hypothetical protein